jgi:hypothetical protein
MSTTGKSMGIVSRPGRICVEMNAREVNIVAAHSSDSLTFVSDRPLMPETMVSYGKRFAKVH